MKIVIDIDEDSYRFIKKTHSMSGFMVDNIRNAIENGIVLHKGHGRLIDADNAISKICGGSCGCHFEECGYDKPCFSVTRIKSAQTIIEADKAESEEKHDTDR